MNEFDTKKWILSMSRDSKFKLMESMLKKDAFGEYMAFIKILLDAPCGEGGGIPTEEINAIWDKYMKVDRVDFEDDGKPVATYKKEIPKE